MAVLRRLALAAVLDLPRALVREGLRAVRAAEAGEVHVLGLGALDQVGSPGMQESLGRGALAGALSVQLFHGRPIRVVGLRDFDREGLLPGTPGLEGFVPEDPRMKTLVKKAVLLQRVVERLPPDDFVLYMDATDAFLQRPASELPGRYLALLAARRRAGDVAAEEGQEPVVMNGVAYCWPFQDWSESPSVPTSADLHRPDHRYAVRGGLLGRELCASYNASFRALDGPSPFPESGLWFGRVRGALRMLKAIVAAFAAEGEDQDQAALILARLAEPGLFVVDGHAELFWAAEARLQNPCGLFGLHANAFESEELRGYSKAARDFLRAVQPPGLCAEGYFRQASGWLPPPLRGRRAAPAAVHVPGCVKRAVMQRCFDALAAVGVARGMLGSPDRAPTVRAHDEDRQRTLTFRVELP